MGLLSAFLLKYAVPQGGKRIQKLQRLLLALEESWHYSLLKVTVRSYMQILNFLKIPLTGRMTSSHDTTFEKSLSFLFLCLKMKLHFSQTLLFIQQDQVLSRHSWASLEEKAICKHSSIISKLRRRKFLEAYLRSLPSRIIFGLQKTLSQCHRTDRLACL